MYRSNATVNVTKTPREILKHQWNLSAREVNDLFSRDDNSGNPRLLETAMIAEIIGDIVGGYARTETILRIIFQESLTV